MNIPPVLHVHVASYIFISKRTHALIDINVGGKKCIWIKIMQRSLIALAIVNANKLYFYIAYLPGNLSGKDSVGPPTMESGQHQGAALSLLNHLIHLRAVTFAFLPSTTSLS